VRRLAGAERFVALQGCLYGPVLPPDHAGLFPLVAALAVRTPVFLVERAASDWTADAVADVLLRG
jgi:hypothetical protein